jgi:hypothetical protein
MFKTITLIILTSLSFASWAAWDGTAVGVVKQIDVTAEENMGFRVYLKNASNGELKTHCGSHNFAFLNKSSSNYETYVSILLAAKMSKTSVIIYSNAEPSSSGYCHIGYVGLYDQ